MVLGWYLLLIDVTIVQSVDVSSLAANPSPPGSLHAHVTGRAESRGAGG